MKTVNLHGAKTHLSRLEELTIVTSDAAFAAYDVKLPDARA